MNFYSQFTLHYLIHVLQYSPLTLTPYASHTALQCTTFLHNTYILNYLYEGIILIIIQYGFTTNLHE